MIVRIHRSNQVPASSYYLLILSLVFIWPLADAADAPAPTMFPLEIVVPEYPLPAARERLGGIVLVKFNVTTEGVVTSPQIVLSQPPGVFDESALAAALKLRYRPQVRRGQPISVEDVQYLFRYDPDESFGIPTDN